MNLCNLCPYRMNITHDLWFSTLNLSEAPMRCERMAVTGSFPFHSTVKQPLTFPSRASTCATRIQVGQVSPACVSVWHMPSCGHGITADCQPRSFADNYHLRHWSVFACWWQGTLYEVWNDALPLLRLLLGNSFCRETEVLKRGLSEASQKRALQALHAQSTSFESLLMMLTTVWMRSKIHYIKASLHLEEK